MNQSSSSSRPISKITHSSHFLFSFMVFRFLSSCFFFLVGIFSCFFLPSVGSSSSFLLFCMSSLGWVWYPLSVFFLASNSDFISLYLSAISLSFWANFSRLSVCEANRRTLTGRQSKGKVGFGLWHDGKALHWLGWKGRTEHWQAAERMLEGESSWCQWQIESPNY